MDKQLHKLTKTISKSLVKRTSKKELIIGSIVATFIAITPYLFTLYESVPQTQVWDTFLFTYDTEYYGTVFVLAWTLTGKLVPLFLLLIWIFTCRHWWYHVLIVPIAMYVYQIMTVLNDDLDFADDNQIIYLLPVMAIIIPSIYLLRAKLSDKIDDATKTMEEQEEELMAKPKGFFGKFSDYF